MDRTWEFWVESVKGARHRRKKMKCQDQYSCKMIDGKIAVALVDGIGKTDVNAMAGKRVSEMVVTFLHEYSENIKDAKEYVIAFNLMRQVQRLLDRMSKEYRVDMKELASTLLGIYINPHEDYYVICHLGDGVIASLDFNKNVRIISEPQNGRSMNQTILTTSDAALGNMKIRKSTLGNIDSFVMATDGFYSTREEKNALNRVFMVEKEGDKIEEKIDDQTVIKIFCTERENKS